MREHRGATVVGVEPHPERAQAARAKGFEVVDGEFDETLAHRLGTFDAVIFADVLEHMPDPASALLASKSFLRPTGFVVASVPNVAHWSVRLNLLRGRFDYVDMGIMDATHLRWFTRRSLVAMFASCGFEVVQLQWSIGRWLREYRQQWPWRWMSFWVRGKVIRRCILLWPEAFGCQMVVKAVCSG
jgi:2-polyprenyl-3-methyl-5-hydroxy-6-metoxy-1,4-benzoquinol methylase